MDNGTRYLYEVRPRKPVRIPGQRATMVRRSVLLTKDEVREYMKSGPVYRKSTKGEMIQVTGGNLDKLHAPFDGEKNNSQVSTAPSSFQHVDIKQAQQPVANNLQQWNSNRKKNKHNNGNSNYHGDDRGKAAINGSVPDPQYNNNQSQLESNQVPVAPVVNLP